MLPLQNYFSGRWRITRLGWDAVRHQTIRLEGTATFTASLDGIVMEERGTLRLGPYRGEAERRLVFILHGPFDAEVRFEDGRPFHRIELRDGQTRVRHECAPDLYEGRYGMREPDRWRMGWRILGPRKRQVLSTVFSRDRPA